MQLTGKQVQQIQDALLDGFSSKDELRMMVRIKLERNLAAIVGGDDLRVLIFNLVTWAEQNGRVTDLIQGACEYNPDNEALQQLAQEWRSAGKSGSHAASDTPTTQPTDWCVSIDLFLSYSRKNLAVMCTVRGILREAELSVWTDEGLEPGTPAWASAIEDAIGQAQALVVLLSPDAKASAWVGKEVTYAQALGKRVFTVLVAGDTPVGAVPINLIDVQWVDARQNLRRAVVQELRPAILRHLRRPQLSLPPIEFDWVIVPAGEFLMGSDKSKDRQAYGDETPQYGLYLPEYRIAKYLVTNALNMEFVKATSHETPKHWDQGGACMVTQVTGTFADIYAWDNLYSAFRKAAKGKRGRSAAARFEYRLEDNLIQLQDELAHETYRPGPYNSFTIHEPKRRLISAAPFRDRVVHHALCQVLEPAFERSFIEHAYANRIGKGIHCALDTCQRWAQGYPYVLQCGVRQFFPSIDLLGGWQKLTRQQPA